MPDLGITVLAGTESNVLPDGSLDYADDVLEQLDWVIASLHTSFRLSEKEQTERMLRAMEHPLVDVIGHPTGRLIESREAYALDLDRVIAKAVETGTFLEINANPDRRDLNDVYARAAAEAGVTLVIDSDAHWPRTLKNMRYGVATGAPRLAHRGPGGNTRPWAELGSCASAGVASSAARPDRLRPARSGAARGAAAASAGRTGELLSNQNSTPSRPSMAATALDCRRHRSATSRKKPVATTGTCGTKKPTTPARTVMTASGQSRLNITAPGSSSGSVFGAARLGEQARDALARLGPPPEPEPGEHRDAPPDRGHVDERVRVRARGADHGHHRRARCRRPPNSSTDTRRKSRNLMRRPARPAPAGRPRSPSTTRSACSTISGGPSSERTPTLTARRRALLDQLASAAKPSRSVTSSPPKSAVRAPELSTRSRTAWPLSDRHGRPDLEHLPAPVDRQPRGLGLLSDSLEARARPCPRPGAPRQWKVMIGPLSSMRTRMRAQLRRVALAPRSPSPRFSQLLNASSTRGVLDPGSSSSAPCEPAYATPPTPTSRRTSAAERPEMHATQP